VLWRGRRGQTCIRRIGEGSSSPTSRSSRSTRCASSLGPAWAPSFPACRRPGRRSGWPA
jgi:hypothetical protein